MSDFTFDELGVYHGDGSIPTGGELRSNGVFWNPDDMLEYLERGSLAHVDENGVVHTHPAVHIVKMTYDENFDEEFHQVVIVDEY